MSRVIAIAAILFSFNSWSQCSTDQALKARGFKVHKRNFSQYYKRAEQWLKKDASQFRDDLQGTIYSSSASQMVTIESFDHLATPQDVMFGDVVFMETFRGSNPIEVRWYENGQKHVAYNRQLQACATNTIPFAYNALL